MPSLLSGSSSGLPLLSLAKYRKGLTQEKSEFIIELHDSLSRTGFVKVKDHGISQDMVEELFDWNRKFFNISAKEKAKFANVRGPEPQRGYSAVGDENSSTLYGSEFGGENLTTRSDAREHWDQGPPGDKEYANRWPDENVLPGFRYFMETSFDRFKHICHDILEALEFAVGLPQGSYTTKCEENASEFRFLHYPAIDIGKLRSGRISRIWPHYDLGVITLLFQDDIGGLEMDSRDGSQTNFIPVKKTSGTELVVNISETMQRWTNGTMLAGLHQVTLPSDLKAESSGTVPDRYSIAYFCKANRESSVGPLPQFVTSDRPARYDDVTAIEYHQSRLETAYK